MHSAPHARIDRPVDKRRASHPLPQAALKLAAAEHRAAHRKERIKLAKAAKARAVYAQRYPHGKRAELKRKMERNDLSTEDIKRLQRLERQREKENFKKVTLTGAR